MNSSFVDREPELSFLEERWRSGRSELVVVYGRRRVGKTTLLQRISNRRCRYALFAREGFTSGLQRIAAQRNDIALVTGLELITPEPNHQA